MPDAWLRLALLDDGWERVTIRHGFPFPSHSHISCERRSGLTGKPFSAMYALRTDWLEMDAPQAQMFRRFGEVYAAAVSAAVDEQWTGPPAVSIEAQMEALANAILMRGCGP